MTFRPDRVSFATDVVVQVVGGEAIVLNLSDETVFALNPTGARIAELIEAGLAIDAIVEALCAEYAATRDDVAPDVSALVEALLARKLVVPAPDEDAG